MISFQGSNSKRGAMHMCSSTSRSLRIVSPQIQPWKSVYPFVITMLGNDHRGIIIWGTRVPFGPIDVHDVYLIDWNGRKSHVMADDDSVVYGPAASKIVLRIAKSIAV